jgi:hypothetical protein
VANYWLRARPTSGGEGTGNFSNFINVGVLHYAGAPNANPLEDPSVNVPVLQLPLNETDLHVSQTFIFLWSPH